MIATLFSSRFDDDFELTSRVEEKWDFMKICIGTDIVRDLVLSSIDPKLMQNYKRIYTIIYLAKI